MVFSLEVGVNDINVSYLDSFLDVVIICDFICSNQIRYANYNSLVVADWNVRL